MKRSKEIVVNGLNMMPYFLKPDTESDRRGKGDREVGNEKEEERRICTGSVGVTSAVSYGIPHPTPPHALYRISPISIISINNEGRFG